MVLTALAILNMARFKPEQERLTPTPAAETSLSQTAGAGALPNITVDRS